MPWPSLAVVEAHQQTHILAQLAVIGNGVYQDILIALVGVVDNIAIASGVKDLRVSRGFAPGFAAVVGERHSAVVSFISAPYAHHQSPVGEFHNLRFVAVVVARNLRGVPSVAAVVAIAGVAREFAAPSCVGSHLNHEKQSAVAHLAGVARTGERSYPIGMSGE